MVLESPPADRHSKHNGAISARHEKGTLQTLTIILPSHVPKNFKIFKIIEIYKNFNPFTNWAY
jgi:hypothetical protein